jgi:nucleotide-binding universal stress UspA family protein
MFHQPILVPLDGSALSEAALPYASAIARALHQPLRLISVLTPSDFPLFAQEIRTDVDRYLEDKVSALRADGTGATWESIDGTPVLELLRLSGSGTISMIVMATHGRGGLQRWALGSVADKVMRASSIATLLVRPGEGGPPAGAVVLRRLLVPLDGSPLSEAAIEPAVELARAAKAELMLYRVEEWMITKLALAAESSYIPNISQLDDEAEAAAVEYLAGLQGRIPKDVSSHIVVERGPVAPLLESFANERAIDLVVMSTHGRSGFMRFAIGSKADVLVRAGVPTLLIRPELQDEAQAANVQAAVAGRR